MASPSAKHLFGTDSSILISIDVCIDSEGLAQSRAPFDAIVMKFTINDLEHLSAICREWNTQQSILLCCETASSILAR